MFFGPFLDPPKGTLQWCDCLDKWQGCVMVIDPSSCLQMVILLLRSDKAKYSRPKRCRKEDRRSVLRAMRGGAEV